jgi:cobalt/nickel transport system permease protein
MHIPDGYISPQTYIPSYAISIPLLAYAFNKLKSELNEKTLPLISTLTALSFVAMMISIPLPGGTSGHAIGTAMLSILFNPWIAYISISLVVFIQAVMFGDGGITTFPINSLLMGFVSAWVGYGIYHILKNLNGTLALFLAGWGSVVVSSFFMAIILGIQPYIAHTESGRPLFFPFGLEITIPTIVGSHAIYFGVIEGVFTVLTVRFIEKLDQFKIKRKTQKV